MLFLNTTAFAPFAGGFAKGTLSRIAGNRVILTDVVRLDQRGNHVKRLGGPVHCKAWDLRSSLVSASRLRFQDPTASSSRRRFMKILALSGVAAILLIIFAL